MLFFLSFLTFCEHVWIYVNKHDYPNGKSIEFNCSCLFVFILFWFKKKCILNFVKHVSNENPSFFFFYYSILDSEFQFVLSRRGKPQLCYQGYLFNSDAIKNGRVYWRCVETRRSTCAARLLTIQDKLIEKQPIHDHEPNSFRVDGKKLISYESCIEYFDFAHKQIEAKQEAQFTYEYVDTE